MKAGKGIRTLDIQLGKRVSQAPLERKPHCGSLNAGASYRLCRLFLRTSVQFRTTGTPWGLGIPSEAEAVVGTPEDGRGGAAGRGAQDIRVVAPGAAAEHAGRTGHRTKRVRRARRSFRHRPATHPHQLASTGIPRGRPFRRQLRTIRRSIGNICPSPGFSADPANRSSDRVAATASTGARRRSSTSVK